MSKPDKFWFHCGRCGTLFRSPAGDFNGRVCPNCGGDPATGLPETLPPEPAATAGRAPASGPKRGKRTIRKRKNRHLTLKLIAGWTSLLFLIVLGARMKWHRAAPQGGPSRNAAGAPPALADDDIILLQKAGPLCGAVFEGFLAAGVPEKQNQFVSSPVTTASRMARFYDLNPITSIDPAKLSLAGTGLLNLPGGKALEAHWKSADGKTLDVVFREEQGEWRLDWEHYARYSDYPWSLFLAGSGPAEGEFRLLARERLAEERKDAETISLVLYAPRFGQPREAGFQSPEFLVPRRGREGALLEAAFKLARGGGKVYDSRLPDLNPDGMIRVRLKVRRTEVDMERKFEITGVAACHWFSVDDPGVQPPPPTEVKPPGN